MQDFLLPSGSGPGTTILMVTHDIEEAIYLVAADLRAGRRTGPGDRRDPRAVRRQPRTASSMRDPRFLDLRDEIQELLTTHVER